MPTRVEPALDEPFLDDPFPRMPIRADTDLLPEPAVRRPRRPRPAEPELPPITRPTQLELNGGAGLYTLPPTDILGAGTPAPGAHPGQ